MKVALFVDVASLWFGARRYGKQVLGANDAKIDYAKLKRHVIDGREVALCLAFTQERPGMDPFLKALEHMGYEVVMVPQTEQVSTALEDELMDSLGDTDFDVAVVVSIEGEFSAVFKVLKAAGKQVEVHSFPIECPIMSSVRDIDKYLPLPNDILRLNESTEHKPAAARTWRR